MIELKQARQQWAWVAPILGFLLLLGIGWFLLWYWQGGLSASDSLNAETKAALAAGNARPGGGNNGIQFGAAGNRRVTPTLQVFGKGSIQNREMNGVEYTLVTAGPGQMAVQRVGADNFQFTFAVRTEEAFGGADLKYVDFINQLAVNPLAQQQASVPAELSQQLLSATNGGHDLVWAPLKIEPGDLQNIKTLWSAYLGAATDSLHQTAGAKLLDAVEVLCKSAVVQNRETLAGQLAMLHRLVPAEKEAQFRQAIQQAKAARAIPLPRTSSAPIAAPAASPATQPATAPTLTPP